MSDFVRFIVKCVQFHRDGNTDPSEVKIGEVLDITENQWLRLRQSAPFSFELIERRVPRPEPVVREATPEEEEAEAELSKKRVEPKRKPRAKVADKVAAQDAEA